MQVPVLTISMTPAAGSKVSFVDGHNTVKLTYSSDISLVYAEVRITKEGEDYDIGVGNLAYSASGSLAANTDYIANINVNSTLFDKGDGKYVISVYAKNQPDGSWSEYHYFIDVNGLDFIPLNSDGLEVVTDQSIPE